MNESDTRSTVRPAVTLALGGAQRERGYRRHATKLLLFLLAGAIINVAVAWGCAAVSRTLAGRWEFYDARGCNIRVMREPGACSVIAIRHQNVQASLNSTHSTATFWLLPGAIPSPEWNTGEYKMEWRTIECYGWPLTSMQHEIERTLLPKTGASATHPLRWGWQTNLSKTVTMMGGSFGPISETRPCIMPLCFIWPYFAINTIFYAGVLWALFALPQAVRWHIARVRRKRGQCAACGYSLRENISEKCPECGALYSLFPRSGASERAGVRAR